MSLCVSSLSHEKASTVITIQSPGEKKAGVPYDFIRALYQLEQGRVEEAKVLFIAVSENPSVEALVGEYCKDFVWYLDEMLRYRADDLYQRKLLDQCLTRLFQNAQSIAAWLSKYESGKEFRYASVIPYFCARNFEQNIHYNFRLYEYYFRTLIAPSSFLSYQDGDMLCLYIREFYRTLRGTKDDARTVLLLVDTYRSRYEDKIGEGGEYIKQSLYLTSVERWCTNRLNKFGVWAVFNQFPDYWF